MFTYTTTRFGSVIGFVTGNDQFKVAVDRRNTEAAEIKLGELLRPCKNRYQALDALRQVERSYR